MDPLLIMAGRVADLVVQDVCELPDRTSPDDWPEALLVTGEELAAIVQQRLETFFKSLAQAQTTGAE